jgi:hypothetical protein
MKDKKNQWGKLSQIRNPFLFMVFCGLGISWMGCDAETASSETEAPAFFIETHRSGSSAQNAQAAQYNKRLADKFGEHPTVAELERLYQKGTAEGEMPTGVASGRAFMEALEADASGSVVVGKIKIVGIDQKSKQTLDGLVNWFWTGKVFFAKSDPADPSIVGEITNRVLENNAVSAVVHRIGQHNDPNQANTFFLDYSNSNDPIAQSIRDYMRKIDTDLYLGKAFTEDPTTHKRTLLCYFALDFSSSKKGMTTE